MTQAARCRAGRLIGGVLVAGTLAACGSSSGADDDGGTTLAGRAQAQCKKLAAAGCNIGSEAQCEQSITLSSSEAHSAGCDHQFDTVLRCRETGTIVCDSQGNLQSPECTAESQALNACLAD